MTPFRRVLRAIAIIMSLIVIIYWVWASVHEIATSNRGLAIILSRKGIAYALFVLPAGSSIIALAYVRRKVVRFVAIALNVVSALWWILYSLAMPSFSVYQQFWSLFAFAPIVALVALVLTGDGT
jgi:hypothetical protein